LCEYPLIDIKTGPLEIAMNHCYIEIIQFLIDKYKDKFSISNFSINQNLLHAKKPARFEIIQMGIISRRNIHRCWRHWWPLNHQRNLSYLTFEIRQLRILRRKKIERFNQKTFRIYFIRNLIVSWKNNWNWNHWWWRRTRRKKKRRRKKRRWRKKRWCRN